MSIKDEKKVKQGHFILLSMLFFFSGLTAQESDYRYCDSILSLSNLSAQRLELLDSAIFSMNYYNSDAPRKLYHRSIIAAKSSNQIADAAHFEMMLADLFYELEHMDSSRYFALDAARMFQDIGDELGYARTANIRRLIYTTDKDFLTAYNISYEALEIFERFNDIVGMSISYRDIASIMIHEEKYDDALRYCLKAVEGLFAEQNWYELTFTYQRIAIIYKNLESYELAQEYIQKAMDACRKLTGFRIEQGLAKKYWTRGYIYEEEGEFEKAINYYDSSKYFAQIIGFRSIDKYIFNNKGEIFLKQEKYSAALNEFEKSLAFSANQKVDQNAYDYYTPVYSNIVKAYEGLGDYKSANDYIRKIAIAKDSIFAIESEKQIAELQTKYETTEKEKAIVQLQEDKLLQRNFLIVGTILFFSLTGVALLLWRNNRYRKNVNEILEFQKSKILEKSNQNELLLKEIHHRVKNNLQILSSLLSLQSNYIKDEEALFAIKEGRNRVESMGMIHQRLYSGDENTAIELHEYVDDLCSFLSDSFLIESQNIHILTNVQVPPVDVETAIPLGLIINELITNSLKYAFINRESGEIKVQLWINENNQLCLIVQDNGVGDGVKLNGSVKSSNFGTDLVNILIKKLKGNITRRSEGGFSTNITFDTYKLVHNSEEQIDLS